MFFKHKNNDILFLFIKNAHLMFMTDAVVKQKLNSLLFVKNICEGRIRRIQEGSLDDIEEVSCH